MNYVSAKFFLETKPHCIVLTGLELTAIHLTLPLELEECTTTLGQTQFLIS